MSTLSDLSIQHLDLIECSLYGYTNLSKQLSHWELYCRIGRLFIPAWKQRFNKMQELRQLQRLENKQTIITELSKKKKLNVDIDHIYLACSIMERFNIKEVNCYYKEASQKKDILRPKYNLVPPLNRFREDVLDLPPKPLKDYKPIIDTINFHVV